MISLPEGSRIWLVADSPVIRGIHRDLILLSASPLRAGKYPPSRLPEKTFADGCLKKQTAGFGITSTLQTCRGQYYLTTIDTDVASDTGS